VLAPLLMMGRRWVGLRQCSSRTRGAGFWPLGQYGAILGGTMRAPFTAILFALELTHDINVLLPLLVAAMLAHATTVLLAEALHPHGGRSRAVDSITVNTRPIRSKSLFVREVMRTSWWCFRRMQPSSSYGIRCFANGAAGPTFVSRGGRRKEGSGVITRSQLRALTQSSAPKLHWAYRAEPLWRVRTNR